MTAGKLINTTDTKANYFISEEAQPIKEWGEVYEPKVLEDQSKVDYSITDKKDPIYQSSGDILDKMRENIKSKEEIDEYCDNFENNMKQKKLSYLQVNSVEEGAEWYKKEFPKLPDELCDIMGRWNWGELSTLTKKQLKNDKKKITKGKANKKQKQLYNLGVKQGNFVLDFN
jgi:DNA repair ATPase RecN